MPLIYNLQLITLFISHYFPYLGLWARDDYPHFCWWENKDMDKVDVSKQRPGLEASCPDPSWASIPWRQRV